MVIVINAVVVVVALGETSDSVDGVTAQQFRSGSLIFFGVARKTENNR